MRTTVGALLLIALAVGLSACSSSTITSTATTGAPGRPTSIPGMPMAPPGEVFTVPTAAQAAGVIVSARAAEKAAVAAPTMGGVTGTRPAMLLVVSGDTRAPELAWVVPVTSTTGGFVPLSRPVGAASPAPYPYAVVFVDPTTGHVTGAHAFAA